MWLTSRERVMLLVIGLVLVGGVSLRAWQQQRPPITVSFGVPPPAAEWDARVEEARRVDVNRAGREELERLPEIGPVVAQRILAYRQAHGRLARVEELLEVSGIGPKTFEAIRAYVRVE